MDEIRFARVVQLVDQLTPAEKHALREHLDQVITPSDSSSVDRIARFNTAIDSMREGLTSQQLEELEWAMNYEFIAEDDLE
jgi:hypothetical protein